MPGRHNRAKRNGVATQTGKKWDDVKDKILAAGRPSAKKKAEDEKKHAERVHENFGSTVGGVKERKQAPNQRPEATSVYYKEGTRGGNRSKPFDTGK